MNDLTFRSMTVRYLPLLAGLAVLAGFVSMVPAGDRRTGESTAPVAPEAGPSGTLAPRAGQDPDAPPRQPEGTAEHAVGAGARTTNGDEVTAAGSADEHRTGSQGLPRSEDCSRLEVIDSPTCRPTPPWQGDNGGATMRNVTGSEIHVVAYEPWRNPQVDAILAARGVATADERRDVNEALGAYFNGVFETFGRRVRITFQHGPGQNNDASAQQADATLVAEELGASFVIAGAASLAFHEELARRGVPSFSYTMQFPQDLYRDRAPYLWAIWPDLDLTLDHTAEYYCRRVNGRTARHAGDPLLRQSERSLGIIYPDDGLDAGPRLAERVRACGGTVGAVVGYAGDISTATHQAATIIAQMRNEGITTLTCTCDPIAPVFITNAATNQGYFPEWLHNGVFLTDDPLFGRLYNQEQWARSFGVSSLGYYVPLRQTPGFRAYFTAKPDGDRRAAARAAFVYYPMLLYIFSGVEGAGPELTPRSFAEVLFGLPPRGDEPNDVRTSFGRQGASPFTAVDDMMEIWWDPRRTGPDGEPGWAHYVNAGQRYRLNAWPTSEPEVFVHDGSAQPGRDPDA